MKNSAITTIILLIIVGGGAFFGGIKYQQSQPSGRQFAVGQGGTRGTGFASAGRNGINRPVSGEILNSDGKSMTVKLPDGSSKIVIISATTMINKASSATADDLKTGEKVSVFGQTNSDGSVTAQSIQLNPIQRQINPAPIQN
jgi:hypothetical protein